MGAVGLLVRTDVRQRWLSLLAVVVLLGLGGAVVLTAIAGARRTESAYSRLTERVRTADASVEVSPEYFAEIAALPQVEAVGPASFLFVFIPGLEDEDALTMASVDGRFSRDVDAMLVVVGRRPRDDRPNEVLVDAHTAERLALGVGDRITLSSLAPDQLEPLIMGEDIGEPAGPAIDVTVVGIGRGDEELASRTPIMLFTPAFYEQRGNDVAHFDDILQVRLRDGDADVAAFEHAVGEIVPASEGAIVQTRRETSAEIENATRLQAVSLVAFALALGLALFVAVGQALARHAADASVDHPALRSLGVSRRQRFAVLVMPGLLVAVTGSVLAAVLAAAASPTMPIGFARKLEPDPGLAVDWVALGVGFLVVAALVIARVSMSAWRTSGLHSRRSARSSWAVGRLAALGVSPPLQTGVRLALEPGHGRTAVPVRPALVGAAVGVAGLVAAIAFGGALRWAVTEPIAYGLAWDTNVVGPRDVVELERQVARLADDDRVAGVAALSVLPIRLNGIPAQSYGIEAVKGGDFVTVLEGRAPQGATEILVGAGTLDRFDREIGDTISASPLEGGAPHELTIVGSGVFPEFIHPAVPDSDTGSYDDFALLSLDGNAALGEGAGGEYFSLALVRWASGVDRAAAREDFGQDGLEVLDVGRPQGFLNLEEVDAFPWVVASFLVLEAAVATGHAIAMSVRRRGGSLAVLRTLGFERRQVRSALAWQATTLAAVGLTVGVPLGLVIGRAAWAVVADGLGIEVHNPIPWLSLVLMVPAVLVVTNLLALAPGRRSTHTRPADALRTE